MIANFADLLTAAGEQPQPQRLLFLFAKADKAAGTIEPQMCVDKLPGELKSFKALVAEADKVSKDWDFVFIAGLDGSGGQPPSSETAGARLKEMADNVMTGYGISQYLVFDRDENTVDLQIR